MRVTIISFGFKYGQPSDAQLQFDVRCLPNPYYIPDLKPLCGLDKPVSDYLFSFAQSKAYLETLTQMVALTAGLFQEKEKQSLRVYVGCTGGHHRSVAMARALEQRLRQQNILCTLQHRDLQQECCQAGQDAKV